MQIIIGNIIMLIASIIMVTSGLFESKKKFFAIYTIQVIIAAIGNGVLGSYSGMINNLLSGLRNFLEYHKKLTKAIKGIIIFLTILLTICCNNIGIIGWLPALACILFIIFMSTENVMILKALVIGTNFLWTIHDFYIMAYTAAIFDILYILTNTISIIKMKKMKPSV